MISRMFPPPVDLPHDQVPALHENIRYHLLDGSLYVLGMSLISVQTILPVFIRELGGSPLSIGSVQVLWTLGQNIPSIFIAYYLRRSVLFSPAMVSWGLAHRMMLLVCGLSVLLLVGTVSTQFIVPIFLFLIFLIPTIGSVSGLPWFQVFTKTVPVTLRGRLMGFRQLLGSLGGVIGGSIVGVILYAVAFPTDFALLFILAFVFTMTSFFFLTRITEVPSVRRGDLFPESDIIADVKRILKENNNFRYFLTADILTVMALSASSFYAVYALEQYNLSSSYAGTFTGVMMLSNIAATILFGYIADAYGHKVNLLAYAGCTALGGMIAIISPNVLVYGFVFFFLACGSTIQMISRLSFVAELSSEEDRPVYIGIVNTFTAPSAFMGLLFGWLIPKVGYEMIFLIASLIAGLSFLILYRSVTEPRNIMTNGNQ